MGMVCCPNCQRMYADLAPACPQCQPLWIALVGMIGMWIAASILGGVLFAPIIAAVMWLCGWL